MTPGSFHPAERVALEKSVFFDRTLNEGREAAAVKRYKSEDLLRHRSKLHELHPSWGSRRQGHGVGGLLLIRVTRRHLPAKTVTRGTTSSLGRRTPVLLPPLVISGARREVVRTFKLRQEGLADFLRYKVNLGGR